MKSQSIQLIVRVVIVLAILVLVLVLIEKNLSLSGKKTLTYHFDGTPNASVGVWGGQLEEAVKNAEGGAYQKPTKNTLYFDVKTMVGYKTATVVVKGRGLEGTQVAIHIPPTATSYRTTQTSTAQTTLTASLDLQGAVRTKDKYIFALFFAQKSTEPIELSEMTITLEKDRITLGKITDKLQSLWKK